MSAFNQLAQLYDVGTQTGQPIWDMIQRGNVDVNHRPSITNADGSKSSIFSMTVPLDKSGNPVEWESPAIASYALVPSIAGGKFLTPDGKMPTTDAGNRLLEKSATDYYRKTKQHLGIFNTSAAADQYAALNHDYGNNGSAAKVYAPSPSLSASVGYMQGNVNAQPSAAVTAPINMPGNANFQNLLQLLKR